MIDITPQQLRKAADIKERIDALQDEFNEILGAPAPADHEARKEYKFSAGARARMRKAQKARWARIRGTAPLVKPSRKMSAQGLANIRAGVAKRMAKLGRTGSAKAVKKPKRKFTAAGRARLAALARARWAKVKAQGKSSL